ncbi:hypothetical protein [Roseivirga misakiensis]|uniref:Uncharacterized protein n=1 Tax=Roseivirga misakiensis TaxID=1563681 RepID=A0A1E5T5S0_9BACT|nr:hypothetical protein [Roseivirga misakiensis]OEK06688.1 hypothetical protein BFP71_03215 [Roseivirga misakiensis]
MKKFLSTLMVSAAMVAIINPLSAQNCDWEPELETVLYGKCINLIGPGGTMGYYCDTIAFGENGADCTKNNPWY